ncbi:hypothetical protein [Brevibacillus formosus]|uniref:hypothetical protein n=1 Tax=Brevibacillus formosus TaxID=54913 RepID=UPI003F529463
METKHSRILQVYSDQDGMLETELGMFDKQHATTYFNELDGGGLIYTFEMTHGAIVEAEHLSQLKRKVVLSRIFDFDTKGGAVTFKELLPWIVAALAIMF